MKLEREDICAGKAGGGSEARNVPRVGEKGGKGPVWAFWLGGAKSVNGWVKEFQRTEVGRSGLGIGFWELEGCQERKGGQEGVGLGGSKSVNGWVKEFQRTEVGRRGLGIGFGRFWS